MEHTELFPQDQVLWYHTQPFAKGLRQALTVDVVVVGGGMAGLSAAQSFRQKGLSVALLEKTYCGAGASGKSSGFITPNSEFALTDFIRLFGAQAAERLWQFAESGVSFIRKNIHDFSLACDYQVQDTLIVATSQRAVRRVLEPEQEARERFGYSSKLYTRDELTQLVSSPHYFGGLAYGDSFSINGYLYCQGMKAALQDLGVQVYEETPVLHIDDHGVQTPFANITANQVVVCVDRFLPELGKFTYEIYHAQTFLMASAPLTDEQVRAVFGTKPYMVWDTDLIYNYYRLTGQNRLLLGGASLLSTYASQAQHDNQRAFNKLTSYSQNMFGNNGIVWEYLWPGLIGISKDIMPIAGSDQELKHVYYVAGAAGLPWAAALGAYSAEHTIDHRTDLNEFFNPYRRFPLGTFAQRLLGTKLTFALSNFMKVGSL